MKKGTNDCIDSICILDAISEAIFPPSSLIANWDGYGAEPIILFQTVYFGVLAKYEA